MQFAFGVCGWFGHREDQCTEFIGNNCNNQGGNKTHKRCQWGSVCKRKQGLTSALLSKLMQKNMDQTKSTNHLQSIYRVIRVHG